MARLTAIGDMDDLLLGQDGYCGSRSYAPKRSWQNIPLPAVRQTWMRIAATGPMRSRCGGEFSFTPKDDTAYILRYTAQRDHCAFELFRVVPGADPVRERLTREPNRSCLFQ